MSDRTWLLVAKSMLPTPVRRALRAVLHYAQRVGRWMVILWQIRGVNWKDEWTLLRSAMASPILSLRSLLDWQDPILLANAEVKVVGIGRFALRAHCDDLWHVLPWREQTIANLLNQTLKPGDVFIDAGANIGIYTVLASRLVAPTGMVLSIEMMPDTADRLAVNLQLNDLDNVTIVRNALSDIAGHSLVATVQSGKYGQATISTDSANFGLGRQVSVQTTTLDQIAANIAHVRLIKMDLEGAELRALFGAKSTLSKVDALVYESWGWKREASAPVDEFLKSNEFNLRQLDGNNWLAERAKQV